MRGFRKFFRGGGGGPKDMFRFALGGGWGFEAYFRVHVFYDMNLGNANFSRGNPLTL